MNNHDYEKNEEFTAYVDSDLEDLIPGYLEGRHEDIAALMKSLEEEDYESLRVLGHNMKGTGGGYGFDMITEIGKSIEIAAKEKKGEEILIKVDALKTYLANVKIIYE